MTETASIQIAESDVALIEELCAATIRAGQVQLAIQGFALTLRFRAETGLHPKRRKDDQ